eukprot:gene56028-biopygen39992
MRLLLNSADHNQGLAKIRLGMTRSMRQRYKHLTTASSMFPDIILDRRLTAAKLVLIPQALKNALGGVALLARKAEIVLKPLVDEAGLCTGERIVEVHQQHADCRAGFDVDPKASPATVPGPSIKRECPRYQSLPQSNRAI